MELRSRGRVAAGGLRHVASALSAFYLALLAWLAAIALLPALLGWTPYVITTGSMAPRIPAGTVLVTAPPPAVPVAPGAVIVFADSSGRTVTHRVVGIDDEGRYRTRGDANPTPDAAPVDPGTVRGVGRIVVPLIGLPVAWALEGRWLEAVLAVAASAGASWVGLGVLRRWRGDQPPEPPEPPDPGPPEPGQPARHRVPTATLAAAVLAVVATGVALAGASFVAAATQPSNRWSAAGTFGGILAFTATDLPAGDTDAAQVFAFTLGSALPGGASVTIDLTEAYQGPVDYRDATQPVASLGQATLETRRGSSPLREAEIVWDPPPGGLPGGLEVTITIPSGITTGEPVAGLPAVATRTDSGDGLTALFAVY